MASGGEWRIANGKWQMRMADAGFGSGAVSGLGAGFAAAGDEVDEVGGIDDVVVVDVDSCGGGSPKPRTDPLGFPTTLQALRRSLGCCIVLLMGYPRGNERQVVASRPSITGRPPTLEGDVAKTESFTAIDLFAGAGGLAEGFRQAGFRCLVANDFDPSAGETFAAAFPEVTFVPGPIQDISNEDILEVAGLKRGELDVLVGGPPCQAFSVYNHQRGMHDERSGMFREYLRVVKGLLPRSVVMENVTGITSIEEGKAVDEIHLALRKLGYTVEHRVLKAEEYGVPQERRRIFFVGVRNGHSIKWPVPTHHGRGMDSLFGEREREPFVTVWDAIGDLPKLAIDEGEEVCDYGTSPTSDYQRLMRKSCRKLYNHVAPHLAPINLQRLRHIPPGGSWRDIPRSLLPAGMKAARRSDHTKRYGRLEKSGLASTILTKCDLHWGAFIHPSQERTLTVREAARCQSFPDRFRFGGPRVDQFRQVGNAVPPLLARAVASSVAEMLEVPATRKGLVEVAS